MDSTEIGILVGSALLHQAFFLSISGDSRGDGAKLKSCYLSHLHCAVAVTSCMVYWMTQPVELSSAVWMVEGPPGVNSQWMRWTIAFSVPPPPGGSWGGAFLPRGQNCQYNNILCGEAGGMDDFAEPTEARLQTETCAEESDCEPCCSNRREEGHTSA